MKFKSCLITETLVICFQVCKRSVLKVDFDVTDLDWNLNGLENGKLSVDWLRKRILKGFSNVLAQERRWIGEYKESISTEDLQTRKSYKALHKADNAWTPSWKRKYC